MPLGPGEVLGTEQVQLLQRQFQPERNAGCRTIVCPSLLQQHLQQFGIEAAVVTATDGLGNRSRFVEIQQRQLNQLDSWALRKRLRFAAGDGGRHQAGILG